MGTFAEIKDIVDNINNAKEDAKNNTPVTVGRGGYGSISRAASKAIYYFPILISKNVVPSTMTMITKNLEASYCSFVSACFALTPAMNLGESKLVNVEDYLKLFHQNVGLQTKSDLYTSLKEDTTEWDMFPNEPLNEANGSNISSILSRNVGNFQVDIKGSKDGKDSKDGDKNSKDEVKYKIDQNRIKKETIAQNGFRPSVVEVEVVFMIGGKDVKVNIPVGVKTVMHPVDPAELTDHVMESVAGKGLLHNLIRYTTGELHSLSDIIIGTNRIKRNVTKNTDLSRWIDSLEHRKRMNKIRNSIPFLAKRPYLPNTSIILSMDDVKEIERVIGYNLLTDTSRTIKFMRDNFLLSFVISDDVTETVYILYDGHNEFQEFPFSSIKRENSKSEDIVNALIKGIGMGRNV